jgi:hypothetical protein
VRLSLKESRMKFIGAPSSTGNLGQRSGEIYGFFLVPTQILKPLGFFAG